MTRVPPRRLPLATLSLLVAGVALAVLGATVPGFPGTDGDVRAGGAAGGDVTSAGGAPTWTEAAWTTPIGADWTDDAVLYHVFVDRFADGAAPDTQVAGTPDDADYAAALTDWMGGDLDGVHRRLDHIVSTGANTVWLSPVNPGPFFHGYHPTDLAAVGERFGDEEALRRFVAAAQERGLKVVYDLVLNHTSDQHPWFVAAQADCAGSDRVEFYRFRDCPGAYDAFAGLPELPQLDSDHEPYRDHVAQVVLPYWLDDIGVDGFRLDHVEGPSRGFWSFVRSELDERWPDTMLLGEIWAQQAIIDSYGDEVDAATAFPFRDRLIATFARGGDVRAVAMPVASRLGPDGLPLRDRPLAATYLSSHDQSRFLYEAGGDTSAVALAYAAILTLPGQPVIYYGDEVGLSQTESLPDGADFADRWFREPMPWDTDAWDHDLRAVVSEVARLRTTSPALTRGAYIPIVDEGETWIFERIEERQRLLVALHLGEDTAEVALPSAASAAGPVLRWAADVAVGEPAGFAAIEASSAQLAEELQAGADRLALPPRSVTVVPLTP
ncbi:MAG: hypothetical protein JJT89_16605 [Nitriliruptoraceae bacterium]|nr:hypothetical protein [Nitriliruptoraceae bacterium]